MAKIVKLTLNDELYDALERHAGDGMSISDLLRELIRKEVYPDQRRVLTPEAAAEKALEMFRAGEEFTVPQLLENEEIDTATSVFGRKFFKIIKSERFSRKIVFSGHYSKDGCALYIRKEDQQ